MKQVFTFELQRKSGNKGIKGGNQMISTNDRMHPIVKSQISRYLRELAKEAVLSEGMNETYSPEKPCNVTLVVYPPTKRRMDPHNWAITLKALIDGMTDAGLFTDDDYHVIDTVSFTHGKDISHSKKYHLHVIVEGVR